MIGLMISFLMCVSERNYIFWRIAEHKAREVIGELLARIAEHSGKEGKIYGHPHFCNTD
ncbi:hypothetical protein EMIT0P265_200033 [Pseudomonas zeae]